MLEEMPTPPFGRLARRARAAGARTDGTAAGARPGADRGTSGEHGLVRALVLRSPLHSPHRYLCRPDFGGALSVAGGCPLGATFQVAHGGFARTRASHALPS